jgi:signal transduction histidine kinase
MDDEALFDEVRREIAAQSDAETAAALEPLYRELWAARDRDDGRVGGALRALAAAHVAGPGGAATVVRAVLLAGRALVERAGLGADGARRLWSHIDDAAVQAAAAVEEARSARRQSWLAYLAHEFKNPLNTVLNALWLLREKGSDRKQAARFVELAERAVKRLETRVQDMRALDEQLTIAPPGWDAQRSSSLHQQ